MRVLRALPLILALAMATLAACVPIQPTVPPAAPSATSPAVAATPAMSTGQPGPTPTAPGIATPAPSPRTPDALAGTHWQLVSFGLQGTPTPALPAAQVTLEFEAGGQAGGSGGCNSYGGSYQVQGNTLTFSQIISTLMACTDNQVNRQEQRYLKALQTAGAFEVAGDRLTIWYDNRQGMLNFVAARAATPAAQATARAAATQAPAGAAPAVVLPAVTPAEPPERVEFAAGSTSAQRSSLLPSGLGVKQYVLAAQAGQTLTVVMTSDGVPLSVIVEAPTGMRWVSQATPVDGGYRATQTAALPEAGDYRVTLAKADHTPSTNYQVAFALVTK